MSIGDTDLMGSDVPPELFQPMRSVYLSLTVDSIAEAEQVFKLLSESGEVFMPMQETFFARPVRHVPRPVRNIMDDHQRASDAPERLTLGGAARLVT